MGEGPDDAKGRAGQLGGDLPAGTWRLDPERTVITVTARAMFGLFGVRGRLQLVEAEVRIPGAGGSPEARAVVDATSFQSGNATRDRDVTGPVLLDAGAHPQLAFESHQVQPGAGGWTVTGSLVAHGTAVPVQLRVAALQVTGEEARFRAEGELDRFAFGVAGKRGMVGRRARLAVEAVATRV